MTSREMKSALEIRVPHRIPQVSRLAKVLGRAMDRNVSRSAVGRKRVRSGVPFSRYAEGRNVKAEASSEGEGVEVGGSF
jgi:hypothetical protein